MTSRTSFLRKVIYIGAVALLLFPLFMLGQPASFSTRTGKKSGGQLAQLRERYNLSQAQLGEIDPASESMKLATLGMRGVAANLLWDKANEYKKTEDWDNLSATLNQITKLQPNFISVWEFQAHNLSYNVSVEFDNFEHRYHWVKKGIDFLISGTQYNREEPRLLHTIGWYFGQKLGRSDEYRQYRRLFREDSDFHNELNDHIRIDDREALGPENRRPDNWLVGRLWYLEAQRAVDRLGRPLKGKSPLIFHADRPMSVINFSTAIEEEGYFQEKAQQSWTWGGREWNGYGDRLIPTSWGFSIRLNDKEKEQQRVEQLNQELNDLAQSNERVRQKKLEALSTTERKLYEVPVEQRPAQFSDEDWATLYAIQRKMKITPLDIADEAPPEVRDRARRIAREVQKSATLVQRISGYRNIVNFEYWRTRCAAEQTEDATRAREQLFLANNAREQANLEDSRDKYNAAWALWANIFKQFPSLRDDLSRDDLLPALDSYRLVLSQLGEDVPPEFPLQWLLEEQAGTASAGGAPATAPPDEASTEPEIEKADVEPSRPEPSPPTEPDPSKADADKKAVEKPAEAAKTDPERAPGTKPDADGEAADSNSAEPDSTNLETNGAGQSASR